MSDSIQGNQTFADASHLPAALPKTFEWLQKVVNFGQRLSKKLRTTNSSNEREDDPVYFGM